MLDEHQTQKERALPPSSCKSLASLIEALKFMITLHIAFESELRHKQEIRAEISTSILLSSAKGEQVYLFSV